MNSTRDVIPGTEVLQQVRDDMNSPQVVFQPTLIDVSGIRDRGMQAVVAFAASLEWNILTRRNSPVTLIARNGYKQTIPTDTSVRFGVFTNRVNAIITHSITAIPTPELVEAIIKQYKLDASHARVFWDAVGRDERLLPEEEPFVGAPLPAGSVTYWVETERVEPTLAMATKGAQYVSPIMETVIRQLTPEGEEQITYRCKICALEFPSKRGVGSHYQRHVQAGEAEATVDMPKTYVTGRDPNYVPTERQATVVPEPEVGELLEAAEQALVEYEAVVEEPEPEPGPEPGPRALPLDMVAALLQDVVDDAVRHAIAGLQQQLDAAHAEIERLKHERIILRDLLQ